MKTLLAILLSLGLAGAAHATVTFEEDFDDGDYASISTLDYEECCSYSLQDEFSIVRAGAASLRFEVHEDDPDQAGSKRVEVTTFTLAQSQGHYGGIGDTRWIGISLYMPADWETDNQSETILQFHGKADNCESSRSPPMALRHAGDGTWGWRIRADSDACTSSQPSVVTIEDFGEVLVGQWVDIVINVTWGFDGTGVFKVWKNGVLTVDYSGPNMYNDAAPVYLKFGVYKFLWKTNPGRSVVTERVIYFDELKSGDENSSFDEVSPGGPPPGPIARYQQMMMGIGR